MCQMDLLGAAVVQVVQVSGGCRGTCCPVLTPEEVAVARALEPRSAGPVNRFNPSRDLWVHWQCELLGAGQSQRLHHVLKLEGSDAL